MEEGGPLYGILNKKVCIEGGPCNQLVKMTPKYHIFLERGKPQPEYFSIGSVIFWHLGACRMLFCVKLDLKINFLKP